MTQKQSAECCMTYATIPSDGILSFLWPNQPTGYDVQTCANHFLKNFNICLANISQHVYRADLCKLCARFVRSVLTDPTSAATTSKALCRGDAEFTWT